MTELTKALQLERERLAWLLKKLDSATTDRPEGTLIATSSHGTAQYYIKLPNGTKQYLKKDNLKLAAGLAQCEYNKKIIPLISKELASVDELLSYKEPDAENEMYNKLPEAKRVLIKPIKMSNENYASKWQAIQFEGKGFASEEVEIYAERGERVRSKSEKIIADKLYSMGVPYRYECPLKLKSFGAVYPDFTVLNVAQRKEYYWEHFGMMDNPEYCYKALKKINSYINAGIIPGRQLITTFESTKCPLDTRTIGDIIKHIVLDF